MPRVTPPGGCRRAEFQVICPTWWPRRGKRRRRRSRAGPGCREPGRTASSSADRRARRLPARPAAATLRPSAAVMNPCRSVCGVTALAIPARRAVVRTIRPAPCRSSRRPSAARNTGPPMRSPMARSIARAVRGASGMVTILPPLRVMVRVRCPRSRPRCSMSAPVASETRSPFSASSEISAYPGGGPRPAARRARCGRGQPHETRSPLVAAGRAQLGSGPRALPRRRTYRTRRWWTAAG